MAIMTDAKGNIFLEFLEIDEDQIEAAPLDAPLPQNEAATRFRGGSIIKLNGQFCATLLSEKNSGQRPKSMNHL